MAERSRAQVLTTREARTELSRLFAGFRKAGAKAEPVVVGAHRKPEAVVMGYETYRSLLELIDDLSIVGELRGRLASRDAGAPALSLDDAARQLGVDPEDLEPR